MGRRLDVMIAASERGQTSTDSAGYATAEALIADLRLIEDTLESAGSTSLASTLVRPVRREVESFRFSTVRLDARENTTKLNAALADLWRRTAGRDGRTDDGPVPDQ